MWTLIQASETRLFGIALAVMILLGVLECVSLMLGGASDWLDSLLPDSLTDATSPELTIDADTGSTVIRCLSWLYVGKLPLLMWLVVFLLVYGLTGYAVQAAWFVLFAGWLPMWLAAIAAWLVALPVVRVLAQGLHRVLPKDESTAQASADLVVRGGVVVLGRASSEQAAQVRVKDAFGQQHYVMAKADGADDLLQGSSVLLVSQENGQFRAIVNPNPHLKSDG